MSKKIGFLFGDFDPVYTDQIRMCEDIIHEFGLDQIFLAPSFYPSRRSEQLSTYIENRKDMIKLATWRNKKVNLLEEYDVTDATLATQLEIINKIEAKYNAESYYVITSNNFLRLPNQNGFERLVRDRNIIIAMRPHYTDGVNALLNSMSLKYNSRINISATPNCTISTTLIRACIQMNIIDEKHMPVNMQEYINKNMLYKAHSGLFEKIKDLEPAPIYNHTVATCLNCIELAQIMEINYNDAILSGLLHNIGKCYTVTSLEESGVYVTESCKNADMLSMHGHLGELASKYFFGITSESILDAIKYHSTGRADMPRLSVLLFVAAELAKNYNSADYESGKYSFFENPEVSFLRMLEDKYRAAKKESPLFARPAALRECLKYYKNKKNLAGLFRPQD